MYFPSYAETLGMVTIESMALQKPVVNTNIDGAKELMWMLWFFSASRRSSTIW
jgi:glycosyltransferase involved in cell wall biosynthesis